VPGADLDFEIDSRINALLGGLAKIDLDDGNARREWGWTPTFDLDGMITDFSAAFKDVPAIQK
jgi:nucleoside-diphosphate-sugar epimerase